MDMRYQIRDILTKTHIWTQNWKRVLFYFARPRESVNKHLKAMTENWADFPEVFLKSYNFGQKVSRIMKLILWDSVGHKFSQKHLGPYWPQIRDETEKHVFSFKSEFWLKFLCCSDTRVIMIFYKYYILDVYWLFSKIDAQSKKS